MALRPRTPWARALLPATRCRASGQLGALLSSPVLGVRLLTALQVLQVHTLARHRVRDWHCKGDGLEAVALTDAVLLTEGVVGLVVRRMVESASTVVLAERTIPIKHHPREEV